VAPRSPRDFRHRAPAAPTPSPLTPAPRPRADRARRRCGQIRRGSGRRFHRPGATRRRRAGSGPPVRSTRRHHRAPQPAGTGRPSAPDGVRACSGSAGGRRHSPAGATRRPVRPWSAGGRDARPGSRSPPRASRPSPDPPGVRPGPPMAKTRNPSSSMSNVVTYSDRSIWTVRRRAGQQRRRRGRSGVGHAVDGAGRWCSRRRPPRVRREVHTRRARNHATGVARCVRRSAGAAPRSSRTPEPRCRHGRTNARAPGRRPDRIPGRSERRRHRNATTLRPGGRGSRPARRRLSSQARHPLRLCDKGSEIRCVVF
jgi:hypothetical protein